MYDRQQGITCVPVCCELSVNVRFGQAARAHARLSRAAHGVPRADVAAPLCIPPILSRRRRKAATGPRSTRSSNPAGRAESNHFLYGNRCGRSSRWVGSLSHQVPRASQVAYERPASHAGRPLESRRGDPPMTTFDIGELAVSRVEERLGAGFQPNVLLPDWNKVAIEPHLSWLVPNYYDPKEDKLVSSLHSWVIRTKHHTILIDTCAGNHKDRPSFPRFHMLNTPYLDRLKAAGVDPAKVDFVLCTHLHIDHVGWNPQRANGRWVPTFPNAKYVFSKVDRDFYDPATGEGGKAGEGPKIWADSIQPVIESGQAMAIDMTHKLGDGLLIEPAPGHTP